MNSRIQCFSTRKDNCDKCLEAEKEMKIVYERLG